MILSTVGRGGEGDVGQRIRDEILVVQVDMILFVFPSFPHISPLSTCIDLKLHGKFMFVL